MRLFVELLGIALGAIGFFFRLIGQVIASMAPRLAIPFVIGAIIFAIYLFGALIGFSPSEISAWFDARGGAFEMVGKALFRIFCGFVLLMCLLTMFAALAEFVDWLRKPKQPPAPDAPKPDSPWCGCVIWPVVIFIAYLAWIGVYYGPD